MIAKQINTTTPKPQIITTQAGLLAVTQRLSQESRIAVDTESNSLYAYREQVCLIQISIPGENYLIDPLVLDDLSPLGPIFYTERIEKVFHAADYDLAVLKRDYGFKCHALFDTMWAARVLGWPKVGLADILEQHFGVHANKRYQRYNWGKRPLDPEALTYAWMDTYYLLELREIQQKELQNKGRWQESKEIFDYLCNNGHIHHPHTLDELFWRIKGMQGLGRQEKKALYRLHIWREKTAEQMDRPPIKVINNERLIKLARVQPHNKTELRNSGILTSHQQRRFGNGVLHALRDSNNQVPAPPSLEERPPDEVVERYHALKAWRKDKAAQRGVDSDVVLPNAVLWHIAQAPPEKLEDFQEVPGIGPWRQQAYGSEILKLLR